MNIETIVPLLYIGIIVCCGLLLRKFLNLRNIFKTTGIVGKKISKVYHSIPLLIRISLLILIPFMIYAITVELYRPDIVFYNFSF